jgi:hypothetical protein
MPQTETSPYPKPQETIAQAAQTCQAADLDDFPEELFLSDVQATIIRLRNRIHGPNAAQSGRAPVVLKSHLYTILTDRTAVDREVDALRVQNKVRVYKLATGQCPMLGVFSSNCISHHKQAPF